MGGILAKIACRGKIRTGSLAPIAVPTDIPRVAVALRTRIRRNVNGKQLLQKKKSRGVYAEILK